MTSIRIVVVSAFALGTLLAGGAVAAAPLSGSAAVPVASLLVSNGPVTCCGNG
jgi:hypothetical protein